MNPHKNIVIMEKAVRQAIDNGWDMFGELPFKFKGGGTWAIADKKDPKHTPLLIVQGQGEAADYRAFYELEQVIFNQKFALALWGESRALTRKELKADGFTGGGGEIKSIGWEHHLQALAVAYNRVHYIGENL